MIDPSFWRESEGEGGEEEGNKGGRRAGKGEGASGTQVTEVDRAQPAGGGAWPGRRAEHLHAEQVLVSPPGRRAEHLHAEQCSSPR